MTAEKRFAFDDEREGDSANSSPSSPKPPVLLVSWSRTQRSCSSALLERCVANAIGHRIAISLAHRPDSSTSVAARDGNYVEGGDVAGQPLLNSLEMCSLSGQHSGATLATRAGEAGSERKIGGRRRLGVGGGEVHRFAGQSIRTESDIYNTYLAARGRSEDSVPPGKRVERRPVALPSPAG